MRVYYFGCWNESGHYLFTPGGRRPRETEPVWFSTGGERRHIDATLAPRRFRNSGELTFIAEHPAEAFGRISSKTLECAQGQFLLHYLNTGFSAISWWDRNQGDTRSACNSTMLLEGVHCAEVVVAALKEHFPHVVNNLTKAGVQLVDKGLGL